MARYPSDDDDIVHDRAPWLADCGTTSDDTDPCVGCDAPLTEAAIAYRYSSGEVCCSACAPTPEQAEAERIECRDGWGAPCRNADCAQEVTCWPSPKSAEENQP